MEELGHIVGEPISNKSSNKGWDIIAGVFFDIDGA